MIHPDTEIRQVSPEIGCGVFARKRLPLGTIIYIRDPLEIVLDAAQRALLDPDYREAIARYCYVDAADRWVLSWDHSKYVNHRCECNTMCTGYGFEIALRDIEAGEEITDEYGLFNIAEEIPLACGCAQCRGRLLPTDIDNYHTEWDARIKPALACLQQVEQPLWQFMDAATKNAVQAYLHGDADYLSVLALKRR